MYISLKLAVITVITCINPIYPHEQYLQHAGTVLLPMPMPLPFPVGGDFQFIEKNNKEEDEDII